MEIPQEKIDLFFVDTFNQYLATKGAQEKANKYKTPAIQRKYKRIANCRFNELLARLTVLQILGLYKKYLDFARLKQ